jgi:hypothetical protein
MKKMNSSMFTALRVSLFVQLALIVTGGLLYLLPNQAGQDYVLLLAPFAVGAPLAGMLMQSVFSAPIPFSMMMGVGLITNFFVYAGIIFMGMSLRNQISQNTRLHMN